MAENSACMLAVSTEEAMCEQIFALLADYKDPSVPLPSTRKLGQMLDLSHVTASKALRLMSDRGDLWRSDNGRYYPKTARLIFEAPKPVTCFLRSINAWAGWYPQLMQGIGLACEQSDSGLLIHPVSTLFDQAAAHTAPRIASHAQQRELMESLLLRTQVEGKRLILDDLWHDSVLAEFADRLAGARVLLRPCTVPQLRSVTPDFNQGALLALSHLLGRGYDKIWVVRPFGGVLTIDAVVKAFEAAFASAGADAGRLEVIDNAASLGADALVERLKAQKGRVGIYCAEDNFAQALFHRLHAAGVVVPQKAGLIAGWGTGAVAQLGLSSLRVDLQRLGALAVSAEDSALHPFRPVVGFSLYSGSST